MSVKSTRSLTRNEAEEKYIDLWVEKNKRMIRTQAVILSNVELEDILEEWNDELHDGEGFENYLITDNY